MKTYPTDCLICDTQLPEPSESLHMCCNISYYDDGEVKQLTLKDDVYEVYTYFDLPQETLVLGAQPDSNEYSVKEVVVRLNQVTPELFTLEKEKLYEWIKAMSVFS